MKRKKLHIILLSLLCGTLVTILFKLGVLESLELKSLDMRFHYFAQPQKASQEVVVVAIDEKSLGTFKRNHIVWKWPRDLYAALVRYLHRGGGQGYRFRRAVCGPGCRSAGLGCRTNRR